jgi:hypothetical protein
VENVKQELLRIRPEWNSELSDYIYFGSKDGLPAYVRGLNFAILKS